MSDRSTPEPPPLHLTVLLLVGTGARYGYALERIIEERGSRKWVDIQFSSVYYAIKVLQAKGLFRGKKADVSVRTSKKNWSLTGRG